MRVPWIWVALLGSPFASISQTTLANGTILPVSLDHTLNTRKAYAGQQISAEVMQSIPGTPVLRRAHVLGHVVSAQSPAHGPARLELTFDAVKLRNGMRIPMQSNLRAIASFLEVEEAQIFEEGASRGITPEVATTRQIGGEQVYRGGGPVASGLLPVGTPAPYGVLGVPRAQPGSPCRAIVDDNRQPQAFWLFSTDACGVYGYSSLRIEHAGRSTPMGEIVLTADDGRLVLQNGTALLLRVDSPETSPQGVSSSAH